MHLRYRIAGVLILMFTISLAFCKSQKEVSEHQTSVEKLPTDNPNPDQSAQFWQDVTLKTYETMGSILVDAAEYRLLKVEMEALKNFIDSNTEMESFILDLPGPETKTFTFKLQRSTTMSEELQEKYPEIKSFSGLLVGNSSISIKVDINQKGMFAKVNGGKTVWLISPFFAENNEYHVCYYENHLNDSKSY